MRFLLRFAEMQTWKTYIQFTQIQSNNICIEIAMLLLVCFIGFMREINVCV